MTTIRKSVAAMVLACVAATSSPRAVADYLPTHAAASTVLYDGLSFSSYQEGNGSVNTGLQTYSVGGLNITGQAGTNLDSNHLLAGSSSSQARSYASSASEAAWRDILYVNGATPPPVLRLSFQLSADLSIGGNYASMSGVSLAFSQNPVGLFEGGFGIPNVTAYPTAGQLYAERVLGFGYGDKLNNLASGDGFSWDSTQFAGTQFTGTFHLDLHYNSTLGGYGWAVGMVAYTNVSDDSASTDAYHTLGLQSVTLPDGTPVSASFDSGLQLRSVPEPGSLALVSTGAAALFLRARLRRPGGRGKAFVARSSSTRKRG